MTIKNIVKTTFVILILQISLNSSIAKDWAGTNDTRFVSVGDINNPANPDNKFGAVGYEYSIGKFEVTNAQYAKFMNSVGSNSVDVKGTAVKLYGGFDTSSTYAKFSLISQNETGNVFSVNDGKENYAVNFASAYAAAMYCNWLTNGAPETSTDEILFTGAYNFKEFGATTDIFKAENINGDNTYRLPTVDEWYKAAYYNPDGESYFLYAVESDSISTDMANYNNRNGGTASVKQYEMYPSSYGTLNQSGNVIEWVITADDSYVGTLGGGFYSTIYALKSSAAIVNLDPDNSVGRANGFRVAYSESAIPEPSTYAAILGIFAIGFALYHRKK